MSISTYSTFPIIICNFFLFDIIRVLAIFYMAMIRNPEIGIMVKVFANGLEDLGSILGRVITKTQKMVLDAARLT